MVSIFFGAEPQKRPPHKFTLPTAADSSSRARKIGRVSCIVPECFWHPCSETFTCFTAPLWSSRSMSSPDQLKAWQDALKILQDQNNAGLATSMLRSLVKDFKKGSTFSKITHKGNLSKEVSSMHQSYCRADWVAPGTGCRVVLDVEPGSC